MKNFEDTVARKYKSYKRRGFHSESEHGATQGALGGADISQRQFRIADESASELDLALFPSTLQYGGVRSRYTPNRSLKKRYYPAVRA